VSLYATAEGVLMGDPQQRKTATGNPYVTAQLRAMTAIDSHVTLGLVAWKPEIAKALSDLKQGDSVRIEGSVKESSWIWKDQVKRYAWDVKLEKLTHVREVATQ
jgi:single-stranded DNA-binding protein